MKFPRDKEQYVVGAAIGTSETATTYLGKHKNPATGGEIPVGIKIFNTNRIGDDDIYFFFDEVNEAKSCDHDNMVRIHCSFAADGNEFWVITSPLSGPTIRSTIRSTFRQGLPESAVFVILKETLKVLDYMHGKNLVHLNIRADSIFLPDQEYSGGIKIVPRLLSYGRTSSEEDLPEWAVMKDFGVAKSKSADVWTFGLLAVELFYGEIPADDMSWKNKKISNIGKFIGKLGCNYNEAAAKRRKKMPEELREVVAACLSCEAENRPTTNQLMGFPLFQKNIPAQPCLAKLKEACNRATN